jgi:hypothetical protein
MIINITITSPVAEQSGKIKGIRGAVERIKGTREN